MQWLYALNDPRDQWFADDKLAHLFGAALVMCWTGSWFSVMSAILLVEGFELYRWYWWKKKGFPQPWPWLTDRVSLKDILWGVVGGVVGTW